MAHSDIHIETVADSVFGENAYIAYPAGGAACWIFDPSFEPQPQRIAEIVRQRSLTPAAILITHCHGDHIAGIDAIKKEFPDADVCVPAGEADWLADPDQNLSTAFGMQLRLATAATRLLNPGDRLQLESLEWQALDASGHSPAGLAWYCPQARALVTGDALFAGSIGRTDFPGGSEAQLLANIRANLLVLPDDVVVYPGHGPCTTIGQERATNPFLR